MGPPGGGGGGILTKTLFLEAPFLGGQVGIFSRTQRNGVAREPSRALVVKGRIPARFYGDKKEAIAIHVKERALNKFL